MFKRCISNLLICLTITFNQSFAGPTTVTTVTPTNAPDLLSIIEKHDQALTLSDKADDIMFQKSVMTDMKSEIVAATKGASTEDLKKSLNAILTQIPSDAKREEIQNKMRFATKADLQELLSSPTVLSEAFQGQGSNFVFESAGNILLSALAVGVVILIIMAIINAESYDEFYSYPITYNTYFDSPECSAYDLTSSERQEIRDDAMRECKARADKPSSCRHDGYEVTESYERDFYGEIVFGYCSVKAVTEAERD